MKKTKTFRRDITSSTSCGDPLRCWVCGSNWPSQYDLTLDCESHELRIDRKRVVKLRPRDTDALEVLIDAFPRWITLKHWRDAAMGGDPDDEIRAWTWSHLQKHFIGSRYTIQRGKQGAVRLVDDDTLERERRNELGQIPKTELSKVSGHAVNLSMRIADETMKLAGHGKNARQKPTKLQIAKHGRTLSNPQNPSNPLSKRNLRKPRKAKTNGI